MRVSFIVAAAVLAAGGLPAAAQSLKPGLWEITSKTSGSPQMDQSMAEMQKQLAAMPPEQRKQMEAMLNKSGMSLAKPGAGGAMSVKLCMTKEMVERSDVPMQGDCKVTNQQRSGNTTKVAYTCSNPPSSGEGTYTYLGPEAYTSKMTVKTAVQGKSETITMDGGGKWLGSDCGNIKPPQQPKK